MLPNYNNTKDTSESSNSSETSIIELNNSPNVISLGICLESRKNVRAKTKKNNSKKSPKKEVPKISQKEKKTVPITTFSFLFGEMVQYMSSKSSSDKDFDLEEKLSSLGYPIGEKVLELC